MPLSRPWVASWLLTDGRMWGSGVVCGKLTYVVAHCVQDQRAATE